MKEEITKHNNTIFNLNSEVLSVKSSLRKTEDEHAKAKELLSQRNSFQSAHVFIEADERIQDVEVEEIEDGQEWPESGEQLQQDELLHDTKMAELIQFERLQAEKEELQNLNDMYLNKIKRLEIELAAQAISKKLGIAKTPQGLITKTKTFDFRAPTFYS